MTPREEKQKYVTEVRNRTGLLIDFDSDQCRWPIEEIAPRTYRYCTDDKAHFGSAYCKHHYNIAFTATRRDR